MISSSRESLLRIRARDIPSNGSLPVIGAAGDDLDGKGVFWKNLYQMYQIMRHVSSTETVEITPPLILGAFC